MFRSLMPSEVTRTLIEAARVMVMAATTSYDRTSQVREIGTKAKTSMRPRSIRTAQLKPTRNEVASGDRTTWGTSGASLLGTSPFSGTRCSQDVRSAVPDHQGDE
jgi:hypothetical protein